MLDPSTIVATPAPGRACGTCTLCCKVYDVPDVQSVSGEWCRHTRAGRGCGIHETRPNHCRAFFCLWMTEGWLGPEWKPEKAKMVLAMEPGSYHLAVQVDPGQANAWKRDPYYGQLKRWAAASIEKGRHVLVHVNRNTTVILPDRDVQLGEFAPGDRLVANPRMGPAGLTADVERVRAA